jgi:peptidoglycan hydrolase CwlO-like protein
MNKDSLFFKNIIKINFWKYLSIINFLLIILILIDAFFLNKFFNKRQINLENLSKFANSVKENIDNHQITIEELESKISNLENEVEDLKNENDNRINCERNQGIYKGDGRCSY